MRRGFTCLTAGRQRVLSSIAESVFLEDPDCPTLVVLQQSKTTTKVLAQRARGSRETLFSFSFFFFFYLFIYLFILLIQFNFVTYVRPLKTPAHDDCQSPLPGQVGPGLTV